jgi:uncharacterized membrane protein YqjE
MDDSPDSRSLAEIFADLKKELQEFVQTRLAMLKGELQEKLQTLKVAAPLAGIAGVLLATSYFLLTIALVGIAMAFFANSPYRWFFSFAIVGVLWALLGGILAYVAKREFDLKRLVPRKTLEVLKGDKLWIENEAENKYERRVG